MAQVSMFLKPGDVSALLKPPTAGNQNKTKCASRVQYKKFTNHHFKPMRKLASSVALRLSPADTHRLRPPS